MVPDINLYSVSVYCGWLLHRARHGQLKVHVLLVSIAAPAGLTGTHGPHAKSAYERSSSSSCLCRVGCGLRCEKKHIGDTTCFEEELQMATLSLIGGGGRALILALHSLDVPIYLFISVIMDPYTRFLKVV